MKTLHLYLTRQVFATLVMTVAVFTFVLLVGNALKEILALVVSRQITLGIVFKAVGLLIPYVMAYVVPFAMLTAVLLVFGRVSADQEITAARGSGVSLLAMVTPVVYLGLAMSVACAMFNMWIAPQCRGAYKNLIYEIMVKTSSSLITENRFIEEIPGIVLYIRKKDGDDIHDVRLYKLVNNEIVSRTRAQSGHLTWDQSGRKLKLELYDAILENRTKNTTAEKPGFIGPLPAERSSEWVGAMFGSSEDEIDLTPLLQGERKLRLSEMNFNQLLVEMDQRRRQGVGVGPVLVQLNRQLSFSFASLAFTLIGIPLAIRAHRRETSIGVAISLGLLLLYYTFFIIAEALENKERMHPQLILWIPNFLFQALGGWLLWRANRKV